MAGDVLRNVEVKATDPDPARSLAVCLELGAEDRGILVQRDTYFRVPTGRLKLREERAGSAHLIAYERADAAEPRESRYRLVPVADPAGLREALAVALGMLVVVDKERRLLLWQGVRIHLDRVAGLGTFLELEAVATPGSDLVQERARVAELRSALGLEPARLVAHSYSDALLARGAAGAQDLVAAARAVLGRAHAPYSGYRVGAALRAVDGSIHAGANVENAAYPEGQCAETAALGALVAAGASRLAEVAVMAEGALAAVPCGGCRQRLLELGGPQVPVHLCDAEGVRRTLTLGELLPLAFGPERVLGRG